MKFISIRIFVMLLLDAMFLLPSQCEDDCMVLLRNRKYYYDGTKSVTIGGKTCQRWDSSYPWQMTESVAALGAVNLRSMHNYCRTPNSHPVPWCYTTDTDPINKWQECNIPKCNKDENCMVKLENGKHVYDGTTSVTQSGYTCQRWFESYPWEVNDYIKELGAATRISMRNYCRNADNYIKPWCYTTDSNENWEECAIPICPQAEPDGNWSEWVCPPDCKSSEGCTKMRTCSNPKPKFGGKACPGFSFTNEKCPTHGKWSEWTSCDAICEQGAFICTKQRRCANPSPKFGGKYCDGKKYITVKCLPKLDGNWADWTCPSICESSSGGCNKTRTCTNPKPQQGGRNCTGLSISNIKCPKVGAANNKRTFVIVFTVLIVLIIIVVVFRFTLGNKMKHPFEDAESKMIIDGFLGDEVKPVKPPDEVKPKPSNRRQNRQRN